MEEGGAAAQPLGPQPDPELQQLEALADELQGTAAEAEQTAGGDGAAAAAAAGAAAEQQPAAGPYAAGPAYDNGQLVHQCWEEAVDMNSGHRYWFNRAMGVSQWHPPPGWAGTAAGSAAPAPAPGPAPSAGEAGAAQPPAQPPQQAQQAQAPPSAAAYSPGFYYRDVTGQMQGPFSREQLRGWRDSLPMDLPILQLTEPQAGKQAASSQPPDAAAAGGSAQAEPGAAGGSNGDGSPDTAAAAAGEPSKPAAAQQGAAAEALPEAAAAQGQGQGSCWVQLELARLLGDDELLQRWQLENPEQAAWPGSAPPAGWYEVERQGGTAKSLAEAVLCGLPAHDEAVAVARVAAASGRSMQEVLEWSRQGDYKATAYRVAARGRIQAPTGPESLYAEAASWANPWELEQQLAAAAERRKRGLSGAELRAVRERKKELKRQKQTAWLFT